MLSPSMLVLRATIQLGDNNARTPKIQRNGDAHTDTHREKSREAHREMNTDAHRERNRDTERHTERQTETHAKRQTERRKEKHTRARSACLDLTCEP